MILKKPVEQKLRLVLQIKKPKKLEEQQTESQHQNIVEHSIFLILVKNIQSLRTDCKMNMVLVDGVELDGIGNGAEHGHGALGAQSLEPGVGRTASAMITVDSAAHGRRCVVCFTPDSASDDARDARLMPERVQDIHQRLVQPVQRVTLATPTPELLPAEISPAAIVHGTGQYGQDGVSLVFGEAALYD